MSKHPNNATSAAQARELYAHRHDADEWEDEPEPIESRPSRNAVLSVRLSREVLDALEQAAAAQGETLSEYVRKAITQRMSGAGGPISTVLNRSVGYPETENQTEERQVWSEPSRLGGDSKQNYALQGHSDEA